MSIVSAKHTLNGEEPLILGKCCTGLFLEHFYEHGKITNQVNVAHLKFEAQWYRLYFECATVFWRTSEAPEVPVNSDLSYGLLLNNLSEMSTVVGQVAESLHYSSSESGDVVVSLVFSNEKRLNFAYSAATDSTRIVA
jgi:hypothetical protein